MARATLPDSKVRWESYIDDYDLIRDQIAQVYPAIYSDFGERIKAPRGFHLDIPPRRRVWPTPNGKANFLVLPGLEVNPPVDDRARSEEHTSELQSLMRISYAVFCLTKKKKQ